MENASEIAKPNQDLGIDDQSTETSKSSTKSNQRNNIETTPPSTPIIVLLGIFLGPLGVHDFLIGKKKLGAIHLTITIIIVLFYFISFYYIFRPVGIIFELVLHYLNIANWIWGIIEIAIYGGKDRKKKIADSAKSSPAAPLEKEQRQRLEASIKTTTNVASISSVISIIIELGILSLTFTKCGGSDCAGSGFFLLFLLCIWSLPAFLSTIFSVYTIALALKLKKGNISNNSFRESTLTTILLFVLAVGGLISIVIAINIIKRGSTPDSTAQESETTYSASILLDNTERTPYDARELVNYKDCYTYDENVDYRAARDAICSYLMYAYLDNWGNSITNDDFINSAYTPGYLHGTDKEELGENLVLFKGDAGVTIEIIQQKVYAIVPRRNCNMSYDDNTVSAWYLGDTPGTQNKEDYCVYYNQPDGLYSSETFEKSLQDLRTSYKEEEEKYNFTATYNNGLIIYDNKEFLEKFFLDYDNRLWT